MAHTKWCGKNCSDCSSCCSFDERILCSPDCQNLIGDMINIKGCLDAKCEEIFHVFSIEDLHGVTKTEDYDALGAMLIDRYGSVATYPY